MKSFRIMLKGFLIAIGIIVVIGLGIFFVLLRAAHRRVSVCYRCPALYAMRG